MTHASYQQFCPLAMATEVLCTRWTLVLIREFISGSVRFNELRRGVPKMSPTLLSQRLKELEDAGVIMRKLSQSEKGVFEYHLTEAGRELTGVVHALGRWGQAWVSSTSSLANLDASLLMWDMRRNIDTAPLPKKRTVIEFFYTDAPAPHRHWWLVVEPQGGVDLCWSDPGFEVDVYVTTDLRTMTSVWMGLTSIAKERTRITLSGPESIIQSMQVWLGLSPFATVRKKVA